MTQEEILGYNKRCAEFLGAEPISPKTKYSYFDFGEDWNTDFPFLFQQTVHSNMLKFHSDWNWIMDVVEAIENKVAWVNIKGCAVDISTIANTSASSKKEAVVEAINKFLIWYNENKSKN